MSDEKPRVITRRDILKVAGAAAAVSGAVAAPGTATPGTVAPCRRPWHPAPQHLPRRRAPRRWTLAQEADLLDLITARLILRRGRTRPGAREARAVHYIDRRSPGRCRPRARPIAAGLPRSIATPLVARQAVSRAVADRSGLGAHRRRDRLRHGSGAGFAGSSAQFFAMLRNHTRQGTFGDPFYGGNAQLRRLGSARLSRRAHRWSPPADQQRSSAELKPNRQVGVRLRDVQQGDRAAPLARRGPHAWRLGSRTPTSSIIGLGAAGGVAVLPLAQAGLDVVGLEAGHVAHAARLRARRDPQQRPRLAAGGAEGQSGSADASRQRRRRRPRARASHPMMNARRRHDAALLGAELAAEPVGLQGRQRDDARATARRGSRRARPSRTGRSATTSSSRTTTRSSTRSACRARPATSRARSIRAATSSKAPRKRDYPMPPLRCDRLHRPDGGGGARRSAGIRSRARRRSTRARTRTARPACITASATAAAATSTRRTSTARHHDPARAGDRPLQGRDARARHDDRRRRPGPRHRRHLRDRRRGVLPAGEGRAARELHLRERRGCCCSRSRRRSRTACRTITARSAGTTSATHQGARRHGAVSRST